MFELFKSLLSFFKRLFQRQSKNDECIEQGELAEPGAKMDKEESGVELETLVPEKMMRALLREGSSGIEVKYLQWHLSIDESGIFDESTKKAVVKFQSEQGLTADGIVGKMTWRSLLDLIPLREETEIINSPTESDEHWDNSKLSLTWEKYGGLLTAVSERLDVPKSSLLAVLMVESYGEPFGPDGRPIIRFENHIFHDRWGKKNPDLYDQHFRFATEPGDKRWHNHWFRVDPNGEWIHLHQKSSDSQKIEWEAFDFARTLDNDAAINSASFGLGQVIGFNAEQSGYDDLSTFVEDMNDIRLQVLAMVEFIRNGKTMLEALWERDFYKFAREYNGPGQPEYYGNRIAQFAEEASEHI
jgi:hypothetical protein